MNDHDGEKELVLGNKQLLTIFFVAALLCGVFFAMGYVVGGNSAKPGAAANPDGTAAPVVEGKREEPQPSATTEAAPPATSDFVSQVPGSEPKVADNPVAAGAAPPRQVAVVPQPAPPPPETVPKIAPAPPPDTADTGIFLSVPETGASYWQVAAPTRPAADVLVKSLRDRGLPVILARSSKPELFEVLVGPYRSTLTLADSKKKLTDLGFDGLIVHKQQ
jgi:hypothetical protein